MIFCIVGHGASGKSTIQRYLNDKIPSIITYTTRPIRRKEKDGRDYHFISNNDFIQKIEEGFFVESFHVKANDWYYGTSLDGINYQHKNYTLVIDPNGYKTLLNEIGKFYVRCFYIMIPEQERIMRMAKRGDDIKEIHRRIEADKKDFENFRQYADYTLSSLDSYLNSEVIYDLIKDESNGQKS